MWKYVEFGYYLLSNSVLANSYSSMSSAFSCSMWRFWSGRKWTIVLLDTVELCCSNGMAKRKLNVSSKTYWDIYTKKKHFILYNEKRNVLFDSNLLVLSQPKIRHRCEISLSTRQHNGVAFGNGRPIVATDQRKITEHSGLSIGRQIADASGEFVQIDAQPILTAVAGSQFFRCCRPAQTPVPSTLPGGTSLHMAEFGQIANQWLAQKRYVEISSFCGFAFVFVQFLVNATRQLRPVCVQTAFPAGRIAGEQPVFVSMRPKAVASLAFALAFAWSLQNDINYY